jgi:hypothetical protein
MVFVMLTRRNLREEFAMVDDVFALSPISARSAQPSEADYEAIRDAFMETSRGRWFLGEYAKRNRNADTSMVLDAVARIEHALAAQRQLQQEQAEDSLLPEALAAIRSAIADAAQAADAALDALAIAQNLTPVRKGTRIIREISWRWREIGADSRICDLLDSQVIAIEAACDQIASANPHAALGAAFGIILARLDAFDGADAVPPTADEIVTTPVETPAPSEAAGAGEAEVARFNGEHVPQPAEAVTATAEAAAPAIPVEVAVAPNVPIETVPDMVTTAEAVAVTAAEPLPDVVATGPRSHEIVVEAAVTATAAVTPAVEPPVSRAVSVGERAEMVEQPAPAAGERAETVETPPAAVEEPADAANATADVDDEVILELVAIEMSAPDPVEHNAFNRTRAGDFDADEPVAVDDDIIANFGEPSEPEPVVVAPFATVPRPAPQTDLPQTALPESRVPEPRVPETRAPEPRVPETRVSEPSLVIARAPEPAPPPAPVVQPEPPRPTPILHAVPRSIHEPSLGSTLLAQGLLQRHQGPVHDALTPIRRMTQPEKIAFFS